MIPPIGISYSRIGWLPHALLRGVVTGNTHFRAQWLQSAGEILRPLWENEGSAIGTLKEQSLLRYRRSSPFDLRVSEANEERLRPAFIPARVWARQNEAILQAAMEFEVRGRRLGEG
jgi:hypothetical protein